MSRTPWHPFDNPGQPYQHVWVLDLRRRSSDKLRSISKCTFRKITSQSNSACTGEENKDRAHSTKKENRKTQGMSVESSDFNQGQIGRPASWEQQEYQHRAITALSQGKKNTRSIPMRRDTFDYQSLMKRLSLDSKLDFTCSPHVKSCRRASCGSRGTDRDIESSRDPRGGTGQV